MNNQTPTDSFNARKLQRLATKERKAGMGGVGMGIGALAITALAAPAAPVAAVVAGGFFGAGLLAVGWRNIKNSMTNEGLAMGAGRTKINVAAFNGTPQSQPATPSPGGFQMS